MTRRRVAPALLIALLAACGGSGSDDAGRQPASTSAGDRGPEQVVMGTADRGSPAGGEAAGPGCSYTGRWDLCTITERLDHSGLAPQPATDSAPHPALGAPAAVWTLGNARLLAFVYPDKGAREVAQKRLKTGQYLTPEVEVGMNDLPTLIASDNLLALLYSRNEHQRERVADAITAGPPQAGR
ncbi:MAG: hypothetical protein ACYC4J_14205 [Gemmatimonadaceae bacterium]